MHDRTAREERMPRVVAFILVSVAAFGGLLIAGSLLFAPAQAPGQPRQPSNAEAYSMCRQFMQQKLRAPTTASYAGYTESTVWRESGDYVVLSHVDAQNGFGAMIRTRYACTVRPNGAEQWSLVSLKTDP